MSSRGIPEAYKPQRRAQGLERVGNVLRRLFRTDPVRFYDDLHEQWDNSDDRHTFPEGRE